MWLTCCSRLVRLAFFCGIVEGSHCRRRVLATAHVLDTWQVRYSTAILMPALRIAAMHAWGYASQENRC
jgi:hypothetical protein